MRIDAYVESLKTQHAELDRAITQEAQRPLPDEFALQALKRRKLRIKDEIHRISNA